MKASSIFTPGAAVPPAPFPTGVVPYFAITYKCNMYDLCSYCYTRSLRDAYGEMSPADFAKVLEWFISDCGTKHISLIGGEPTLHSGFSDILASIDTQSATAEIYTNGVFCMDARRAILGCKNLHTVFIHFDDNYMHYGSNMDVFMSNIEAISPQKDVLIRFNVDRVDADLTGVLDVAQRAKCPILYSVTAPSCDQTKQTCAVPIKDVQAYVPILRKLVEESAARGVEARAARPLPLCAFKGAEQLRFFQEKGGLTFICRPKPTVNPDLSVQICSPVTSPGKYRVTDRASLKPLLDEIKGDEECLRWDIASESICTGCNYFHDRICQGGCLTYKTLA